SPAAADFLAGPRERPFPRIDSVNDRARTEALGDLDQGKTGTASDIEHSRHAGERNLVQKQEAEHRRPQRQLIVRGKQLRRLEVDDMVEEIELLLLRRHGTGGDCSRVIDALASAY